MSRYPLQAVALDTDGAPWYPFRVPGNPGTTLYVQKPVLPTEQAEWATVPPEFADRPHLDLDELHLAEVFYLASTEIDLDTPTPEQVTEVLDRQLRACGCDAGRLDSWCSGRPYEVVHHNRMNKCLALSRRLLAA